MGYIPKGAEWFLAELIQELIVEGDEHNIVWRNLTLVRAVSPEEAFEKAMSLGSAGDTEYRNSDGALVTTRFRGISFLDVIHDPLEHGAELLFRSDVGLSEEQIVKLVHRKEELEAFQPARPLDGPDVASADVLRMVCEQLDIEKPKHS